MRYLIVSDIHANWEALEAVLAHAGGQYDRILCCGDIVGYGADPNAVTDWTRSHITEIIRGNHDKASVGLDDLEWFNPAARISAEWTRQVLTPQNLDYLVRLPRGPLVMDGFDLVHGSPIDEDEYLITAQDAGMLRGYIQASLSFFGHSHLQGGFVLHRNGTIRLPKPREGEEEVGIQIERDVTYLINPGSVGQPRDGDWRAAYALYAPDERVVFLRRVNYNVSRAQAKIREAGLPTGLAERLAEGA